jgi:hypothetical protein
MGKKHDGRGRPSKFTPEVIGKLEQAFSIGCSNEEACSYAEINADTFYEWLKLHPEFSERIKRLKEKPFLKARQTIYDSLSGADHAFRFMERKKKKEFGTGVDAALEGAQVTKISVEIVNERRKETPSDIPVSGE